MSPSTKEGRLAEEQLAVAEAFQQGDPDALAAAAGESARHQRQSAVACFQCRRRKVKCNGQRPVCTACQVRGLECGYDVPEGVSRSADMKQRNNDLRQKVHNLALLTSRLQYGADDEAIDIFGRLRSRENLDNIIRSLEPSSADDEALDSPSTTDGGAAHGSAPGSEHDSGSNMNGLHQVVLSPDKTRHIEPSLVMSGHAPLNDVGFSLSDQAMSSVTASSTSTSPLLPQGINVLSFPNYGVSTPMTQVPLQRPFVNGVERSQAFAMDSLGTPSIGPSYGLNVYQGYAPEEMPLNVNPSERTNSAHWQPQKPQPERRH